MRATAVLLVISTLLIGDRTAIAQSTPLAARDSARKEAGPLFTTHDAVIAAGFAVATVAMFPLDGRVAREIEEPSPQSRAFLHHAATDLEVLTSPGVFLADGAMYIGGRLAHLNRLADLGWHGTEAVLLADGATFLLKGVTGRERPFVANDSTPGNFSLGGGFASSDRQSFPSGHTTTAFAAAASISAETSRWWPGTRWIIGPLVYGGATLVGLARIYHDKHWASDVALGAAIGTFSGEKVVQYSHSHRTRLDQIMLHTTVATDARHGLWIGWSSAPP